MDALREHNHGYIVTELKLRGPMSHETIRSNLAHIRETVEESKHPDKQSDGWGRLRMIKSVTSGDSRCRLWLEQFLSSPSSPA